MLNIKYILLLLVIVSSPVAAQKSYREYLRSGNKLYADSVYDKAEIEYRKAIELNPNGSEALYNLGNAMLFQNKAQEAMEQYQMAEKRESDKKNLAQIHHNMGVLCQAAKDYGKAVEYYKQSLRENSTDHETRYNLAVAMRQLKDQQQNEDQQQDQQQQKKEEQKEQEKQQQQQQQKQDQQQDQQQQKQQKENEMSKENAEQLLESAMQDEKEVQEKVKKMMQVRGRKLEKDW